jgi:hypothetical protein
LIPEKTIWKYFVQLCAALEHMHDRRVMHRGTFPARIFCLQFELEDCRAVVGALAVSYREFVLGLSLFANSFLALMPPRPRPQTSSLPTYSSRRTEWLSWGILDLAASSPPLHMWHTPWLERHTTCLLSVFTRMGTISSRTYGLLGACCTRWPRSNRRFMVIR